MLAACSSDTDDARPVDQSAAPAAVAVKGDAPALEGSAPAPTPAVAGDTTGGDGSEIQLGVLTEGEVADASLAGELGCSFSEDGNAPLLVAMGVVGVDAPAQGIVKVGSYVERIYAPGGFNGMLDNPTFSGKGKTIVIKVTGAAIDGGESPPRPALLAYQRADGASRTFNGLWQCGP